MKIGFIGAGKVGFSLGKYFSENGVTVTGYYSRHRKSSEEAAYFTNSRSYDTLEALVSESDTIFLTVPDGAISSVYEEIIQNSIAGKEIVHCSGAMTAGEAFPGIEDRGAAGYAIHPLFPFSDRYGAYRELAGVFFCLEGKNEGLPQWQSMLQGIGLRTKILSGDKKADYHLACSIASNLVCGLYEVSRRHLMNCGFTGEEAMEAVAPLARANLEHILKDGPVQALSGPVERGDTATVSKHLSRLPDSVEFEMYRNLSYILTDMAETKHPEKDFRGLQDLLSKKGGTIK